MAVDRIVIDRAVGVARAAFLDAGQVVELWVEGDDRPSLLGAVALARAKTAGGGGTVVLALPDGQAAYFRGGQSQGGQSQGGQPRDGEAVMVQITRDAVSGKRAVARAAIELSDGLVLLTPGRPGVGLSSAIRGKIRRQALKAALTPMLGDDLGVVVRGAIADMPPEVVAGRTAALVAIWTRASAITGSAPGWLIPPVDIVDACRNHVPGIEPEVDTTGRMFDVCGGTEALEAALAREVPIDGGALVVDRTEAATLIDVNVNQGSRRALQEAAVAAAREVAAQARLRGLRGTVFIDIPRRRDRAEREVLIGALTEAAADDPTPLRALGWTPGGMLECVREGARRPLADEMLEPRSSMPTARAAAWVAVERLRREAMTIARPRLVVAPAVTAWLEGAGAAMVAAERQRLGTLTVVSDPTLSRTEARIESEV